MRIKSIKAFRLLTKAIETTTVPDAMETSAHSFVCEKLHQAELKTVSASTYMAQFFTGGRSVLFFAENCLHTQIRYANFYSEQGTVTLSNSGSLVFRCSCQNFRRTLLIVRVCLNGWPCVTSSRPLPRVSSARAPHDRFQFNVKKDIALVFSWVVQSLE